MLVLEKITEHDGALEYLMPDDDYNKNVLNRARALFSFVDGVVGIGWCRDGTNETNKIQFYKMPKLSRKKNIQANRKGKILDSNFEDIFGQEIHDNSYQIRICHKT